MIVYYLFFFSGEMPPHRFEVNRKLLARSDRVKCVDIHPTEPWLLAALYNGNVLLYNYENQQLVKTFEVSTQLDSVLFCFLF